MQTAFEITPEDVAAVLKAVAIGVGELEIEVLFDQLTSEDFSRIEKAALDAGTSIEEQTDGAHEELKRVLLERKLIYLTDFSAPCAQGIETPGLNVEKLKG